MPRYRLTVEISYEATVEVEANDSTEATSQVYLGDYFIIDQSDVPMRIEVLGRGRQVADDAQS